LIAIVYFALGLTIGFFSAVMSALFFVPILSFAGPLIVVGEVIGSVIVILKKRPWRAGALGVFAGLTLGLPFLLFRFELLLQDIWLHVVFG